MTSKTLLWFLKTQRKLVLPVSFPCGRRELPGWEDKISCVLRVHSLPLKVWLVEFGLMLPAHNPSTQETAAGGLWIQDQYRLHGKALSQKIIVVLESYFRVSNKDLILNIEKGMPQKICIWNIVQFSLFLLYLRMFSLYESYFILEFSSVYLPHPQVTLIFLPSDYKMQLPTSVHSVSSVLPQMP